MKRLEELGAFKERGIINIYEELPYPIVIFNQDGILIHANHAWEEMFQDSKESLAKKPYNIKKDPQIMETLGFTFIERAFAGERLESEPFHYDPGENGYSGRPRWIQLVFYPLSTEPGKIVLILKDITSSKDAESEIRDLYEDLRKLNTQLEERVVERTKELEKSNQALESYAFMISHDLRTPIRAIMSLSNIIFEQFSHELSEEHEKIMNKITTSANRMDQLVLKLLDLNKMKALIPQIEKVDMTSLVNQIVTELKQVHSHREIEFRIGELSEASADPSLITQVFQNLITNAVKFTNHKSPAIIEIDSTIIDGNLTWFIKDNGVGFDKKYKDTIFKVFKQLHSKDEYEGSGIGLSLVASIIEKHNGKVWAESTLGSGSTFFFTLGAVL